MRVAGWLQSIIAAMDFSLHELPAEVFSAAQVRELDRIAIEDEGTPGYTLMCRAGEAALSTLTRRWPAARNVLVCCGAGNNAGDGYVLARLCQGRGLAVRVLAIGPTGRLRGDAATALQDCRESGVAIEEAGSAIGSLRDFAPDVIVDALLGTGADRPVTGAFAEAVDAINSSGTPVLALDIPSGLDADSGMPLGDAVRADATITFVGLKQGLFLGIAPDFRGELSFSDLGVSAGGRGLDPPLRRTTHDDLRAALPPLPRTAHKGDKGRLLLVGGSPGMAGAIRLAAEAALRAGAGLVYVGAQADSVASVMAGRPEIMCHAISGPEDLEPLTGLADAVVLGPGLGAGEWGRSLWSALLDMDAPLIVDADGLNVLAEQPCQRGNWILTPHPGEAARLLGLTSAAVQADRLNCATELAARFGATAVLKGACSLIAAPRSPAGQAVSAAPTSSAAQSAPVAPDTAGSTPTVRVCDYGNPGMATAGTGDVLAGIVGALLARSVPPALAARAGVLLHALAGDDAAADGERGMIATDMLPFIRRWANPA